MHTFPFQMDSFFSFLSRHNITIKAVTAHEYNLTYVR